MFHTADLATRQDEQNGIRANDTEVHIDKITVLSIFLTMFLAILEDTNILHCILKVYVKYLQIYNHRVRNQNLKTLRHPQWVDVVQDRAQCRIVLL
jgi:hypothetical protein